MNGTCAMLIVDVQNDFCPGGALAVMDGNRVIAPLNRAAECFAEAGLPVIATRDWHPPVTRHFREYGGVWPPHCLQNSPGADFPPGLRLPRGTVIVSKGGDPDSDSYSGFNAVDEDGRSLADILAAMHVRHLYVGGLATDYCVLSSVLDARKAGFEVTVMSDAIAGVNLQSGDAEKAIGEMLSSGAHLLAVDEALARLALLPHG